ncbi:MAG: FAD-binding oxidoreductase [Gammaproteobacteria bacterium]|nr:FAD-binding oxidoreductase [Gammaproteobacteria bacterium]
MTQAAPTVAVVGAGVVGICTALELLQAGYRVTLYDRDEPAKQTSFGNLAYIAAEYSTPLATPENILSALKLTFSDKAAFKVTPDHWIRFIPWAMRFLNAARAPRMAHSQSGLLKINAHAVAAWKDLLKVANASDQLVQSGFLKFWEQATDLPATHRFKVMMAELGQPSELVRNEAVFELEPTLSPQISHGLYFPSGYQLRNTFTTCQKLFACFLAQGGQFQQQDVTTIQPEEQGVMIQVGGSPARFDKLVVCAGAWSKVLLKELGLFVPLAAERGYHLTFPTITDRPRHILESADRHVVLTSLDCGLRIGGFGEYANLNSAPVTRRYTQLSQHLTAILRDINPTQKHETWMGIRPTLPDSLPVIDLHPQHPQIGFAFGHHHLGVTQAAISAKWIVERLQGVNSALKPDLPDTTPYSVTRFGS